MSNANAARDVERALEQGWIKNQQVKDASRVRLLQASLDLGEAEAIELALGERADLISLDERDGRSLAQRAESTVTGVLGVLLRAKRSGGIYMVMPELKALSAEVIRGSQL